MTNPQSGCISSTVLDFKETPRLNSRTVPGISSDRDDRKDGGTNVRISLEVIEERRKDDNEKA